MSARSYLRMARSRLRVGFIAGALVASTLFAGAGAQAKPIGAPSFATTQSASFTSGIQVQNLSGTTANAQIVYYNPDGSQAASQSFQIPGNSSYTIFGNTMQAPAGFAGSAVVTADQPIQAVTNLLGSNPTTGEAYDGMTAPSTTVNVPLFQQDNGTPPTDSSIYIQNTSGSPSNVTVVFKDQSNQTVSTQQFTINGNGSITVDQSNDGISGKFVGAAEINGSQPVAVAINQSNGAILFSYTGSTTGGPTLYAPLLELNNSGWYTGFQVQNVGSQPTVVQLFLDGSSSPAAQATLNPGQPVTWFPIPGMTTRIESGVVKSNNGQPLLGVVNQLNSATGQGMTYGAFNSGSQVVNMPLLQFNNSGIYTGEQIQNVGTCPATVNLTVANMSGQQATYTQVIQPNQAYTWFSANNIIPGGARVGSAVARSQQACGQIVGIVDQITGPQQAGDTSYAYEGFNQ